MSRTYPVAAGLLLAALAVPAAATQTDLGKLVTLDVVQAAPREVFQLLARELSCTITVDPAVKKPITLHVAGVPGTEILARICRSIECEYRFDGKDLFIKPLSASRRRQTDSMARQAAFGEEVSRKLANRLPAGMRFEGMSLKDVLDSIAKASGLELRPWKYEGSRKVTIDVGGMTVSEALEAVVRQIDGEGVVMMKTWAGSWAQHRLVNKQ